MAIGVNWAEIWKPVWGPVWTFVEPEPPPAEEPRKQGAGRSKKRRRYTVEVDGEEFPVDSLAEAEAIFAQVREAAQEKAQQVLQRAAKAEKRPSRKVLADARKALPAPVITTDAPVSAAVDALMAEIEALYRSTLQTVEIGALLKRQADEDEDETILMLIA